MTTKTEPQEDRSTGDEEGVTRREFMVAGSVGVAVVVTGCGSEIGGEPDAGGDGGEPDGGDGDDDDADALGDSGQDEDAGGNRAPQWSTIPDQVWVVGVPVYLDLSEYCSDPDDDDLSFSLDLPLPDGVTMSGSVISGTPTAELAETPFIATADDGRVPSDI
jgi:hypothetical protein